MTSLHMCLLKHTEGSKKAFSLCPRSDHTAQETASVFEGCYIRRGVYKTDCKPAVNSEWFIEQF